MTSRPDEGKEFVQWLRDWRSEIRSHSSLEPIRPEKTEDKNESGPDDDSISRGKDIIPEPTSATKR
jgi:hypothetical protein